MKKTNIFFPAIRIPAAFVTTFLVFTLLMSCEQNFLDREPLSELSPGSSFGSENQLRLYTNSFYGILPSGTSLYNERVDHIITTTFSDEQQGTRTVPNTGGGWSWSALRNINFFLQNYSRGGLNETITAPYTGLARFFRAMFYCDKVKQFVADPWYSKAIQAK